MNRQLNQNTTQADFYRFVRFLLVGLVNTGVGYGLFVGFVLVGLGSQPALASAFFIGILWNFVTHARFVFGQSGLHKLPSYILVYMAIWAANALALSMALRGGLSPLLAQAILAPFAAVLSFFLVARVLTGRYPLFGLK